MPSYLGSCHCGKVRFKVEAVIDHVRVCDCSICSRRGALIHRVEENALELLTLWEDLATYKFNTLQATEYFCSVCGILPFRRPRTLMPQIFNAVRGRRKGNIPQTLQKYSVAWRVLNL